MAMTIAQIKEKLDRADEDEFRALERALAADPRKGVASALASARRRHEALEAERQRLAGLYEYEESFSKGDEGLIVGLDEVGRGSVAGPLAVGAVVLPRGELIEGLNDSKKLTAARRGEVAAEIKKHALCWTVAYIPAEDIDRDGMTLSLRRAFGKAIGVIDETLDGVSTVLVDGNPLGIDEREHSIVKGDAKCASIAAASIVAKVERDAFMTKMAEEYPGYLLDVNKGYASPQHIEAIREHGLSAIHRRSFCRSFLQETLF